MLRDERYPYCQDHYFPDSTTSNAEKGKTKAKSSSEDPKGENPQTKLQNGRVSGVLLIKGEYDEFALVIQRPTHFVGRRKVSIPAPGDIVVGRSEGMREMAKIREGITTLTLTLIPGEPRFVGDIESQHDYKLTLSPLTDETPQFLRIESLHPIVEVLALPLSLEAAKKAVAQSQSERMRQPQK